MFRKLSLAAMAAAVMVMAGCNTVEGVGKDVKRGGEKIENAAERAKN